MGFLNTAISLVATITFVLAQDDPLINVYNECSYPVWIDSTTFGGVAEFPAGDGFTQSLSALGNSVGVATNAEYFATTTPKLIFGFSVDSTSEILYYSVTTVDGDPFTTFSVTGSNSECTTVTSPNGVTYACPATSSLLLTVC